MLQSIFTRLAISLQGTPLSPRAKKHHYKENLPETWSYSMDTVTAIAPYVMTTEEYKIKNDLITKLHSVDNRLQEGRVEAKKGRARWCPDVYEQTYHGEALPALNPQIEIYGRSLGLAKVKEARLTHTSLSPNFGIR